MESWLVKIKITKNTHSPTEVLNTLHLKKRNHSKPDVNQQKLDFPTGHWTSWESFGMDSDLKWRNRTDNQMIQTANSACDSFWNHGPVPENFPSTSPTWRCEQILFNMDWNNKTFRLPSGAKNRLWNGLWLKTPGGPDGTQSHSWWGLDVYSPVPMVIVGFDSSPTWHLHVDLQYLGGAWASQSSRLDYSVRSENISCWWTNYFVTLGCHAWKHGVGRKSRHNYKYPLVN